MCKWVNFYPALMNHPAWYANYCAIRFDVPYYNRTRSNSCVCSDIYGPQYFGPCSNYYVFGKRGVAFAVFLARAPQGHPLVEQAMVADFGRFSDYHSHAVVDEYTISYSCSWMYFYPCHAPAQLAQYPCQ